MHGPHVFNFTDVYDALDGAGGARKAETPEALTKQLGQLLANPEAREAMAGRLQARRRTNSAARWSARWPRSSPICCSCGSRWEPPMREPAFWHAPKSWKSHLLRPLGALYGAIAAQRLRRKGFDAGIPVFCVGNYHVGGAGKTPTVLALAKILRELGETPVVLSRGYGGRLRGPVMVDPVAPQRRRCRRRAADAGVASCRSWCRASASTAWRWRSSQRASVILMDDGFQNPSIAKDASLIVIDSDRGLGNGFVFPAGPLRAPLRPQLARTDALIVIGEGAASGAVAAEVAARDGLVLSAHLEPDAASLGHAEAASACSPLPGSAIPQRFFRTLRAAGIEVVRERSLCRSSPVFGRRDRKPGRGGQAAMG